MDLMSRFWDTKQLNAEAATHLLERVINREPDELIWSAVYDLLNRPTIQPPRSELISSASESNDAVLNDLRDDWNRTYFPGSLDVG